MTTRIPDFGSVAVLVVGDVMLDDYWFGATSRISPEAPVPVVRVTGGEGRAGGAANVAINLAALGAPATLAGLTGADANAATLARCPASPPSPSSACCPGTSS
jgi:D-beta-D-heptose 7-phosphate kinase/D-beta-D-heptose 1-phosphate adenosyltransferase